jgi:hypothetical protein
MKLLAKLMRGDVALWCTFWLIGTPLALLWDLSGTCTAVGCGIQDPLFSIVLLLLFTLSSMAIPVVSFAIWRSASKYPRKLWWHSVLAIGAKVCAVLSAILAAIGFLVVLYMGSIFAYAFFDRA